MILASRSFSGWWMMLWRQLRMWTYLRIGWWRLRRTDKLWTPACPINTGVRWWCEPGCRLPTRSADSTHPPCLPAPHCTLHVTFTQIFLIIKLSLSEKYFAQFIVNISILLNIYNLTYDSCSWSWNLCLNWEIEATPSPRPPWPVLLTVKNRPAQLCGVRTLRGCETKVREQRTCEYCPCFQ